MKRRALSCLLAFFGTAAAAAGQEIRTFPEADCSYTLPGKDWEWLDPQLIRIPNGKTIAFAKSQDGLIFTLVYNPLKPRERPDARSYEDFERGFIETSRMTKRGARHLSFRGLPSYQMDVTTPQGQGCAVRLLYANDRFYYLQVASSRGELRAEEAELVLEGFNFTGEPRPVLPSGGQGEEAPFAGESEAFRRGQAVGRALLILMGGGALVGVILLVVFLANKRQRPARRPRRRREDEEDYPGDYEDRPRRRDDRGAGRGGWNDE